MFHPEPQETPAALPASASIYNRGLLAFYDLYVLGFSNRWVWRCASRHILQLYNEQISGNHLEVGVGTAYFPDRCRFPVSKPHLDLLDIHPAPLEAGAKRLKRYQPGCFLGNVLAPISLSDRLYESIAINYLLHCLPGDLLSKGQSVLDQLLPRLKPESGRLFGCTILGTDLPHNALGQKLMALYNARGIFGNTADSEDALHHLLSRNFSRHQIEIRGCVALFSGVSRRR